MEMSSMIEWSLDSFVFRALLGGIGVALLAGPLGCFVVWQRMAYFGETLSHSALLGVVTGLVLGISLNLGVLLVCVLMAVLLIVMQSRPQLGRELPTDTLLGVLSHLALAAGLVLMMLVEDIRLDLNAYLFGDVLSLSWNDLMWIAGVGVVVFVTLFFCWRQLLEITLSEEIAQVEGVPVKRVRLTYMLLMAMVVAMAIKIVGVLLMASLLIIPAAVARRLARTPEQMAIFACLAGCIAVVFGLFASLLWDLPAGPAIVLAAGVLLIAVQFKRSTV
jgi:zinc transport system permease protein